MDAYDGPLSRPCSCLVTLVPLLTSLRIMSDLKTSLALSHAERAYYTGGAVAVDLSQRALFTSQGARVHTLALDDATGIRILIPLCPLSELFNK